MTGDWMMRDPDHRMVEAVGVAAIVTARGEDRAVLRASSALGLGHDPAQVLVGLVAFQAVQRAEAAMDATVLGPIFPNERRPQ